MKLADITKNLSPLKIGLLIIFILYLILPIHTPSFIAGAVDSPLGMVALFIIMIYMFFYSDPVLAIIFIFVAYELLRRSSLVSGRTSIIKYTPSQDKKDSDMAAMNPTHEVSVEEEIIRKMAPVASSRMNSYIETTFKPVAEKVSGSLY